MKRLYLTSSLLLGCTFLVLYLLASSFRDPFPLPQNPAPHSLTTLKTTALVSLK